MTCPRCRRPQPPEGSLPRAGTRYCVHCGRALSGVRWVASTPDESAAREPEVPRPRYGGPPSYRHVPRWSLARWAAPPAPGPDGPLPDPPARDPAAMLRSTAGLLGQLALTTAALALVAGVAEGWRYVLLLASRGSALSPGPLAFSDALVTLAGLLAPVGALATGLVFLRWLLAARVMVAGESGTVPSRPPWAVVLGAVLPPATLTVLGSTLAELEHVASGRPPAERPRPSQQVARWWVGWVMSVVLGLLAVVRGLGDSTQALADAVVLHGLADLAAAVAAVLTVWMVEHLTELIAPVLRTSGRQTVVRVGA